MPGDSPRSRRPAAMPDSALNVHDIRALARRRLPRGMFEFIDRGTEDERGLDAARKALDEIHFAPHVLNDTSGRRTSTDLFGVTQPLPLVVAPTGLAGLMRYEGEIELARAAAK